MTFRGEPGVANRQAADWLARLHADDRTEADEAAFRDWLAADPLHAETFERASAVWDLAGGVSPIPAEPELARATPSSHMSSSHMSRRAVLAGGAAVVVAGGSMVGLSKANAGVYQTEVGEQRRLLLEDGSRLMLDTATRIRFQAGAKLRELTIATGRVDLEIAADPRPFVVEAGARRALAQAARTAQLDVRRDGERVAFTAIAGTARVETQDRMVKLENGERIALGEGQAALVDRPEVEDLTAWHDRRLAFRDETLAHAVAEMNRYSNRSLVLSDSETAQLRVSGMYRVGDPEAFARSLAVLLPLRIDAGTDTIRISSPG